MRQIPEWAYDYPPRPLAVYRVNGKRMARWKLACSMSIEKAMDLWPFTYHPVALPQWRYDAVMANPELCSCATRQHRKKECLIGPNGKPCSICGALHEDYGNGSNYGSNYCKPCADWHEMRETYLADWAPKGWKTPKWPGS